MEVETASDIEHDTAQQAAEIAKQNDLFRNALIDPVAAYEMQQKGIKGQVLVTPGVSGEGAAFQAAALAAVATDTQFTEDNDPWGDHTFGSVTVGDQKLFWKVDLYDLDFRYGSERPFDPTVTQRALTIMCPSEY
ncbi:DUF3768 domain-containing protein [Sedimentitalea todarodis]|uniref:DUF3768 domain-containing protein n=1 Tax=Sedimentitalea todarodis TaxID=1631240 RepID=A0ABU3VFJ7_9RHOB|nr:DUF3768 domain-containing protein [Sedimentitalea todarodis]MDU9004765.1 DUF3768 domain-containing protein [Sedimentitalea todarodis]